MNRFYRSDDEIDDLAQVDGDVAFAPGSAGQPWLRSGIPPWHMWGNSQVVRAAATGSDEVAVFNAGQLCKVAYKRPESWHFLLAAKIIDAPPEFATPNSALVTVRFDVITGIGRSQSQLIDFAIMNWGWTDDNPVPRNVVLWTTTTRTPALRTLNVEGVMTPDPASIRYVNELIGQDIQITCSVAFEIEGFDAGRPHVDVEVSAYLSPKSHLRPDWYIASQPEVKFPGNEIGGT